MLYMLKIWGFHISSRPQGSGLKSGIGVYHSFHGYPDVLAITKKNLGTSQSIRKRQRVPVTFTEGREVPYGIIVIWPLRPF
jgi:hypothetical protein